MNAPKLGSLFAESELNTISGRFNGQSHPTSVMIGDPKYTVVDRGTEQIAFNTDRAIEAILRTNPEWLKRAKPRLLQTKDLTDVSATLAEIRAYGALLDSQFRVTANTVGRRPSAEFDVVTFEGTQLTVEVHAKQIHGGEQARLSERVVKFHAKLEDVAATKPGPHVLISTSEVYPFGEPDPEKPNDSDRTNAISKLCRTKDREHQAKEGIPFVLWMDLQDPHATLLGSHESVPLHSASGAVLSGVAWYAFYGWNGAPVLHRGDAPFGAQTVLTMEHDGRFRQPSNVAAVVLAFPEETALLENPWATTRLNDSSRRMFLTLPGFATDRSFIDWGGTSLHMVIDAYQGTINAAAGVVNSTPEIR